MPYTCGFCGKEFEDIEARAKCELRCAEEIRKKEKEEKEKLAKLERQAAEKELWEIKDHFDEKYSEYIKKYHKAPLRPIAVKAAEKHEAGNEDDFLADLISDLLNSF